MALLRGHRQARRNFLLGLTSAGALALAACVGGPRGPIGPGPGPGPNLPPGERNLVAVIVPLSGNDAGIGQSLANAASLALLDTGEKNIRVSMYDSAGAGGAAAATNRALAEGAGIILGPLLSEDVAAASPIARNAGVPIIAFSNDAGVAAPGVYVLGFTPNQSVDRVVSFARSQGATRFTGIVPQGLYGDRAKAALASAVGNAGGRLGAVETYPRNAVGPKAAATRLKAKGPFDAVLIGDNGRAAANAAPVLPRTAKILGTELWSSDSSLGKTAALRGAFYAAPSDARFQQLTGRYQARYGKQPYRLASLGYDAMLLAVRAAKDWPRGRPFPQRSLLDKDGFAGVDGSFRFRRDGVAERMLEVRQVTAKGTTVVSPAGTKF